TPREVTDRARQSGAVFGVATIAERKLLTTIAGDHWYPWWAAYFAETAPENIVVGRGHRGRLLAALIIGPPGQAQGCVPMLGPGVTTIGCVGTLRDARERGIGTALVAAASELLRDAGGIVCHIGW